jgi:uncharacterized protein YggE
MKKKCILFICSAFLLLNTALLYAQRNGNQVQFKSKSQATYDRKVVYDADEINANNNERNAYQAQTNYLPKTTVYKEDNEIVLQVNSLMNMKAEHFLAVFNVTQVGETTAKTDELMNSRINSFVDAVKQMGIPDKDIYVDMIYLVPTFEFEVEKSVFSKTYNEIPTGFEMQKNVHIAFKDINKVASLVTLAAKNEIYDMVKLDFFVDNTEACFDTLRNKSVAAINKKLASYKKLNLTLSDKFQIVHEASYTFYPETQYPAYDAFVSQSIEAATKKGGVTKLRKPATVAYDQIPYNKYDIIVNPEILEPVVQFVYSLQVKYTLDKPEVKSKNTYMLVTPAGDVKKLDVQ